MLIFLIYFYSMDFLSDILLLFFLQETALFRLVIWFLNFNMKDEVNLT